MAGVIFVGIVIDMIALHSLLKLFHLFSEFVLLRHRLFCHFNLSFNITNALFNVVTSKYLFTMRNLLYFMLHTNAYSYTHIHT